MWGVSTSEFDYVFEVTVIGDDDMHDFVSKFRKIEGYNPFYVSYSGIAPSVLHMNYSARIIFIKHKEGLRNTTTGLKEYLQEILRENDINERVGLLNS